jgi:hypothetical protein
VAKVNLETSWSIRVPYPSAHGPSYGPRQHPPPQAYSIRTTASLPLPPSSTLILLKLWKDGRSSHWYVKQLLFRAPLTQHSVLDGGTGFLKAGYAGQVGLPRHCTIVPMLWQADRLPAELSRPPVPVNSRPPHPANRGTRWRGHQAQGHHVWRRGGGGALDAPDHLPRMWSRRNC